MLGQINYLFLDGDSNHIIDHLIGIKQITPLYQLEVATGLRFIQTILNKRNITFRFCPIPDKGEIYFERLPKHLSIVKETALDSIFTTLKSLNIDFINIKDTFLKKKPNTELYYYCDAHFTLEGSYETYVQIVDSVGIKPFLKTEFKTKILGYKYCDILNMCTLIAKTDLNKIEEKLTSSLFSHQLKERENLILWYLYPVDILIEDKWQTHLLKCYQQFEQHYIKFKEINYLKYKNTDETWIWHNFMIQNSTLILNYIVDEFFGCKLEIDSSTLKPNQLRKYWLDLFLNTSDAKQIFDTLYGIEGYRYYECYKNSQYEINIELTNQFDCEHINIGKRRIRKFTQMNNDLPTAILVHSSYSYLHIAPMLAHHFKLLVSIWDPRSFPLELILEYKPDFVFNEFAARFLVPHHNIEHTYSVKSIYECNSNAVLNELPKDFNWRVYLHLNKDIAQYYNTQLDVSLHWLSNGSFENRKYSTSDPLPNDFNWKTYRDLNPDITAFFNSKEDVEYHWMFYGKTENRTYKLNLLPIDFNSDIYLKLNADVATIFPSDVGAKYHWCNYGQFENRRYKLQPTVLLSINAKDENNMKEWIKYHFALGVNYILLFDDFSEIPLKHFEKQFNNLHVIQQHSLKETYINTAIQYAKSNHIDFMIHLDADEYLYFKDNIKIQDFISKYSNDTSAIYIHWLFFGSNFLEENKETNLLTSYTKCQNEIDKHIKALVKVKDIKCTINPHVYEFNNKNVQVFNTEMKLITDFYQAIQQNFNKNILEHNAYIAHYHNQSWKDHLRRHVNRARDDILNDYRLYPESYKDTFHKMYNDIDNFDLFERNKLYS